MSTKCKNTEKYSTDLQQAATKFTQSMQETGSQAIDTSSFQEDVDKLSQSMSQMANLSQSMDMSAMMSSWMENMTLIGNMMRNGLRLSLFQGTMRQYMDLSDSVYTMNTNFLNQVTQSCMPSMRGIVLP